ncbi:MAG: DUF4255 domain-containing protein [Sciscionella sp.]
MIHEVDEGLRRLLSEAGVAEGGVELVFDAPTRDWSARRNAPTVSLFLYDLREDVSRRRCGTAEELDADGLVVALRTPPRWFQLTYLVTAWTNRPQDEHRLLGEVLRCLVSSEVLPVRMLTGTLAEQGLTIGLETAGAGTDGPSASDVWSALGGELKPAIDLRVTAPLPGERSPAGPAVTEGLVVTSATEPDRDVPPGDTSRRRLRYEGVADPSSEGFAPYRSRDLPAGRRRRGRRSR